VDTIDVVIVGAGIIGCSTAFELSKLGLKVEVIEKHKPGAMGSGWTLAGSKAIRSSLIRNSFSKIFCKRVVYS
tara:strand:- start:379 stop:597 length:219 start_codon:yes stop_codon:yes gene_type:complete